MNKAPAIVTPLDDHMGIDIARSLGKRDIPVYGIDTLTDHSRPGKHSKYCQFVESPPIDERSGENFIQFLVEFGKTQKKKSVLFPLSDETALLCSKYREVLFESYAFTMPPHETMENLATKDGLRSTAQKLGIPAPQTYHIGKHQSIEKIAKQIPYLSGSAQTNRKCILA